MATQVINIEHKDDYPEDQVVYIGRPGPWGNRHIIGRDGNRDEVCDLFETEFLSKVEEDADYRAKVLKELKDKVLMCHCAPERCHGDIIAEWCDSQSAQEGPVVPPKTVKEGPMFIESDPPMQIKWRG